MGIMPLVSEWSREFFQEVSYISEEHIYILLIKEKDRLRERRAGFDFLNEDQRIIIFLV